jgi:PhnB protein
MTPPRDDREDERGEAARIRERLEAWAAALRARDLAALLSHYAADIRSFDLAPPLEHAGTEALRKGLGEWLPTFQGPIGYELRDVRITAGGDVAFSHSLAHMTGTKTSGEEMNIWVRVTVCFRKLDGDWKVVHEHASVPFYMDGSLRAAVDLTP